MRDWTRIAAEILALLVLLCACTAAPAAQVPDAAADFATEQPDPENGTNIVDSKPAPVSPASALPTLQPESQKHVEREDPRAPAYQYMFSDMYVNCPDEFFSPEYTVYLTFDDGPTWLTEKYLDVLSQYEVKATFFVVGLDQDTETGRERLRHIYDEGHTVGIHCYLHNYDALYASVEDYLTDFYKIYRLILEVTGEAPTIFRLPGGSTKLKSYGLRDELLAEMARRGFVCYDWTVSTADTAPNASTEACIRNVVDYCAANRENVVLAHDGKSFVLEALPQIISELQGKGFLFAPLTSSIKPVLFS